MEQIFGYFLDKNHYFRNNSVQAMECLKIYCDLDGVLCDFDLQFVTLFRKRPKEIEDKYGKGFFWSLINKKKEKYWDSMPWTPDGKLLWEYLAPYHPEILSAPPRVGSQYAISGKTSWVRREIGEVPLHLVYKKEKRHFAASNHVLIDDHEQNIEDWKESGGIGILHKNAVSTIASLKEIAAERMQ